ncbi:GNAT family N-acetyltransferase [Parafrankia sp. EUN1f]|uniref:GNAT family N-acetyltransferase n=1 Tax=Parafrankia sp. EUN1f TaxID=102897 RepID=UPI0001C43A2C|nr:GNAT family N-acetyltransferase [Parafrankia sp. EUN1f]EFC84937.1 Acetyltransferase including N-acetylase of ribosomal protein-like protein [Parafrankia sp. EUN1f]
MGLVSDVTESDTDRLRALLASQFDLAIGDLTEDARFVEDLAFDSLQMLELHGIASDLGLAYSDGGLAETFGELRSLYHSRTSDGGSAGTRTVAQAGDDGREATATKPASRQGRLVLTPPLTTAIFDLVPPVHSDVPFLYALATSSETGHRWRYQGRVPPVEKFETELWQSVLTQFVVRRRADGEPVGLVVCYGADVNNGHASLGAVFTPRVSGSGQAVQVVGKFLGHVFDNWRFHKIYLEVPEQNFAAIRSGEGKVFEFEGRLKRHFFYQGRYWDRLILAVTRERFQNLRDSELRDSGTNRPAIDTEEE